MNLQARIELMQWLGNYIRNNNEEWQFVKNEAYRANAWFTPEFIDLACNNIAEYFLQKELLQQWAAHYHLDNNIGSKNVGIVMAGNIPLVGFQDFLAVFISGHRQTIKLSSKDNILLKHLVKKMYEQQITVQNSISFAENLKGCDAYIATGSNNTARYFELYFSKYPHIIRRNRTSAAMLIGNETPEELDALSNDVHQFFGLGCRNVSKLFVPRHYNFVPLLNSFKKYNYFIEHNKYKNNYDYQLSLALLNNMFYMTDGATLLLENKELFSPISVLYYEYYDEEVSAIEALDENDLQCLLGVQNGHPFGSAQQPGLTDYADGVDTMQFLLAL